jgi:Predicted integral membrane protein
MELQPSDGSGASGIYRLPVTIRRIGDVDRSGHWLAQGWRDFVKTPVVSLAYGGAFAAISLVLTFGLRAAGLDSMILPLCLGFIILAPLLVVGLYDASRRLEQGLEVTLGDVFRGVRDHAGQLAAMGIVLMLCYWVWVEIALVLFMGFFNQSPPSLDAFFEEVVFTLNGAFMLGLGTVVGAVIGALVFSISAVSVPLIYDRQVDVITAISTSLLAVRANWQVMFGWAALIIVCSVAGLATLFLGLAVAVPVLAYATWHCYRDVIVLEAVSA